VKDQVLRCRDCGRTFTFTVGEQEFFASRGFTSAPSPCNECRASRKAAQGDSESYSTYQRPKRDLYPAVCAQCHKDTQVPFQPRGDRPVFCSDCFEARRGRSFSGPSRGGARSR
jgi:CxxC-x17-CxxC domain-containing protein